MRQSGFTLLELSIVIVIIGLIVAGISAGQSLVRQAQLRQITSDVNNLRVAINSFKLQYDALPGDMNNASSYWGSALNGDNDGRISMNANTSSGSASETGIAFTHLNNAELVDGSFETGNVLSSNPDIGYDSPFSASKYIFSSYTIAFYSPVNRNQIASSQVNTIRLGGISSFVGSPNTHIGNGVITPAEALSIDQKMDDGTARSGQVSGHNEYLASTENTVGCLEFGGPATSDATGTANYNLGSDFLCNMSFDF